MQTLIPASLAASQTNISGFEFGDLAGTLINEPAEGSDGKAIGFSSSTEVSEVVKFLNTQGDVKAVSSPRVMTLNNQPALISVGKELFYKITSTSALGGGNSVKR